MYCKNCGKQIGDKDKCCPYCGSGTGIENKASSGDAPSAGLAFLSFLFPLVGLILFIVYEGKQPKRAKSAGKGALIGFIVSVIFSILSFILYISGSVLFFDSLSDELAKNVENDVNEVSEQLADDINEQSSAVADAINETSKQVAEEIDSAIPKEKSKDEKLGKYANVSFGEFKVTKDGYISESSLEVTVKNISDKQHSFDIMIEAVDASGARLKTDSVYAEKLNAGQSVKLKAFEFVDEDELEAMKSASFKVLDFDCYDW